MTAATDSGEALRFRVTAVFTITGRGLVAAGLIEAGVFPSRGDRVRVSHGSAAKDTVCAGVEWMKVRPPADPNTVGLLLPELTYDDIGEGAIVTTAAGQTGS